MAGQLAEIKALLQGRVFDLARELAPDGDRAGAYWMARNPTRNDDSAGSFWIRIAGSGLGVWADEATGDGAARAPNGQHKGDIIGLVQYTARLGSVGEALAWSRKFLQLGQMPDADRRRRAAAVQHQVKVADENDEARLAKDRKRAFGLYVQAIGRPFLGSCADLYLQGRAIDIRQLGRKPGVLGWLPPYKRRDGTMTVPSLLAGFQNDAGETVAIHRSFIHCVDGEWLNVKLNGKSVRKIWPAYCGTAIRLWRGSSKLSVDDAIKHGLRERLAFVEGVEDGLALALACPDLRIWCAGSVGNLSAITLPECCDEVIICADNDWAKPQAMAQLDKGVAWFASQGAKVSVARSHVGKDVNDALRGVA